MNNAMNKTALVWVLRVFLVMLTIVAFVATSLPTATAQDPEDAGAGASAASQAERSGAAGAGSEPDGAGAGVAPAGTAGDAAGTGEVAPAPESAGQPASPSAEQAGASAAESSAPKSGEESVDPSKAEEEQGPSDEELAAGIPAEMDSGVLFVDQAQKRSFSTRGLRANGDNPELPQKCGMNIALVFDLSNSIGQNGLSQSKNAANAVIDGLTGTPTKIGLFNFGTSAPAVPEATQAEPVSVSDQAGATSLKEKVALLRLPNPNIPTDDRGGTNWEGGLSQALDKHYDVIYFVTDGVPTTNNFQTGNDRGSTTHSADLNDAVAAAVALKNSGTRIVPIAVNVNPSDVRLLKDSVYLQDSVTPSPGDYSFTNYVGQGLRIYKRNSSNSRWNEVTTNVNEYPNWSDGVKSPQQMLDEISSVGATVPVSSYNTLVAELKKQILAPCKGTLNIVKTIVDEQGNKIEDGVVSGWEFTATAGSEVLVGSNDALEAAQTKATDASGKTTFRIKSDKNQTLTVSETQKEGFNLRKQEEGKNARCFLAKEGQDPEQVEVTNDGDIGFRVTVPTINAVPGTVTCYVENTPMPKASIKKTAANGQHIGEAVQVNPDNSAELTYEITVTNPSANYKAVAVEPKEIVRIPVGVEANGNATVTFESEEGVTVTGDTTSIAKGDLTSGKEVTLADKIELGKGKSQVITVKIPVKVTDTSDEAWARLEVCEGDSATVSAKGVPNSTDMESDVDKNDNNACIPLTKPKASTLFIKKVDAADETKPLNDSKFQLFGSDAAGNIDLTKPITGEGAGNDVLGENLLPGTYYLVETKSPSGYSLLPKPVKLIVKGTSDGYTIELGNPADGGLISVGNDTSGDQPDKFRLVVTVADVETGSLPKTGGFGTGGYALVWMTLVGAAAFLARRQLKA